MNSLWTEKYRPKTVDDFDGPAHIKRFLVHAIAHGHPHLLLYGPPGTGKTTFASLLGPTLSLNASDERGIDTIRNKVKKIANTVARQVIVLDECENLTKDSQTCLRRILEDYPNTTFIFCTNYYDRIIDPLKSRLLKLKFVVRESKMLARIGEHEGLAYDSAFYKELLAKCNGDMRRCINVLQGIKPLAGTAQDAALMDSVTGRVPQQKIDEFWAAGVAGYREYVRSFVFDGYSVLQLVQQLNDKMTGTEKQRGELALALAEAEGQCVAGCTDELVLTSLCMSKITICD